MEKELAYRANHDLLTGLANKSLAEERLLSALKDASDAGGMVGVLLVDLDRFKQVNDSFGHSLGDKLLRQAAERLTYLARSDDCVARTGGDEFVIVAGKVHDRRQIEALAKNVLCSLNRCFYVDEYSIYLSASIGIACYPDNGGTMESLLQSADLAMYRAKAKGKNTYEFFTEDLTVAANDRMALETELFRAMDAAVFEVHYQPKINIADKTLEGCEALVRWKRADGNWISPSVFIPLAEETGLVRRLDMFVLRRACRQQSEWLAQGPGQCAGGGQHVGPQHRGRNLCGRRAGLAEAGGRAAGPCRHRNNRDSLYVQHGRGVTGHRGLERAGGADISGRFWHGLFFALLSAHYAHCQPQNRQVVH